MQKIILFFLVLITLELSSQEQLVVEDSLELSSKELVTFVIPFSSESLLKLKKVNKLTANSEKTSFRSYFFMFLLNLIAIAVLLYSISKEKVKKLVATIFSINVLMQYAKVERKRDNRYLWAFSILLLFFLIAIIFVISYNFNLDLDILRLSSFIIGFLVFDFLLIQISSYIFNLSELREITRFNSYSYTIVMLPFLIVSLLLLLFINTCYTLIIASVLFFILALVYFSKEIRNLIILQANRINVFSFYFFLYLCTFKLLPLIVFFKISYEEVFKV